jgi:uncharacterized membrane protein YphA (DoxX/SURF4 family)
MDRKDAQVAPDSKRWLGLAARLALGGVLVFAGFHKTAAPSEEFAVIIEAYGLVSSDAAQSLAVFLPWVELLVGFALLFGWMTQIAAAAGGAMFAGFLLALGSTLARGIELPNCGCFGGGVHMPVPATMAMDAALLACAAAAFLYGAGTLSLDKWADARYTPADGR